MILPAAHPLQLVLGLGVWFVWFCFNYGGLSLGCAVAPTLPHQGAMIWINGGLSLVMLLTTALLSYWAYRCWRAPLTDNADQAAPRLWIARAAAGMHLAAAVATLAVGIPLLVLPPCV